VLVALLSRRALGCRAATLSFSIVAKRVRIHFTCGCVPRYEHFFSYAPAHLCWYGIHLDFWRTWARMKPQTKTVMQQRARPAARPRPGPSSVPKKKAAGPSTDVTSDAEQSAPADPESSAAELLADNVFRLPAYIRDAISSRSSEVKMTKQFDMPYTDVLTCEVPSHRPADSRGTRI
jgi:hypothetical protein